MWLISKASTFATAAHEAIGQKRKYTGQPYWYHPMAVAQIVDKAGGTPEMIAAAWLHDVVEDTKITLERIESEFGWTVRKYVESLTDVSKPEDGNRAARKAIDREHIAKACPEAKTIKLADLIDNSRSILQNDPDFAKVYIPEKRLLLKVLTEGDQGLWNEAANLVA